MEDHSICFNIKTHSKGRHKTKPNSLDSTCKTEVTRTRERREIRESREPNELGGGSLVLCHAQKECGPVYLKVNVTAVKKNKTKPELNCPSFIFTLLWVTESSGRRESSPSKQSIDCYRQYWKQQILTVFRTSAHVGQKTPKQRVRKENNQVVPKHAQEQF